MYTVGGGDAKLFLKRKRIVISHFKSADDLRKDGGGSEKAKERALSYMRNARDLGTGGRIPWTRDSLHERR